MVTAAAAVAAGGDLVPGYTETALQYGPVFVIGVILTAILR